MSLNVVETAPSSAPSGGERLAVLVHGVMADHRCWRRVPGMLAGLVYRVLAVDLPRHGWSPRRADYRPQALATELVAAVRGRAGLDRGGRGIDLLMGHSLGGRVSALALPELSPRTVVYLDPAFSQPPEFLSRPGRWVVGRTVRAGVASAALRVFSHRDRDDRELTIDMLRRWDPASWRGLRERSALAVPERTSIRSLVIRPTGSMLVDRGAVRQLQERGVTVTTLRTRSHVLFRDDYPGFLSALEGWI